MIKQAIAFIAFVGSVTASAAQTPNTQTLDPQTAEALAARTCELPKIADTAPLEPVPGSNLVTVPVTVNGTAVKFLLDIGIKRPTAVSQELMARLSLPEGYRGGERFGSPGDAFGTGGLTNVRVCDVISGTGCSNRTDRVGVSSFGVGKASGKHLQFAVAEKGEIGRSAPYDGFLTGSFLRQYDVELDFAGKQMTWLTPTRCTDPDQVVFWSHMDVAVMPVTLAKDGRLQMQAMIAGHPIDAEIDTTSARTVMRRDIAELYVGLKPSATDMMPVADLLDSKHMQVYVHVFPQLVFAGGGITALNVPVLIQDYNMVPPDKSVTHLRGIPSDRLPDLTIGMDVLRQLHMYVVPGQSKVYVTAAR